VSLEKKTPSPASSRPSSTRTTSSHREPTPDDLKSAKEPESHILLSREQLPPPQYPASEPSTSCPPPFSSLFTSQPNNARERSDNFVAFTARSPCEAEASGSAAPAYESSSPREALPFDPDQSTTAFRDPVAETKRALPRDTKGDSSRKDDDAEPPPAYSEGDSPLSAFSFLMAAAGGASSIITQVQQGGPPPVSTLGDVGADETIAMDLR
jgi:G patch domain-containing protein 1